MNLVIVESPTKAKTIAKFLGNEYKVESSFGHIRDLPKNELGVDIEADFTPKYVIAKDKSKHVAYLRSLASKAKHIILASDEDREGEAIAWHLVQVLKMPKEKIQRVVFHEITKDAISEAFKSPREIDDNLVDAQQARRILDRLVGYELSPFLWRKVARGLSAGRVQSVAVRLVVEREREIQNFEQEEYWTIDADFQKKGNDIIFPSRLNRIKGKTVKKFDISSKADADTILTALKGAQYYVDSVFQKKVIKKANPPFTTSTLQQEANKKLGYSAKQTMMIAQQLYEGIHIGSDGQIGLITYMRTDSLNLSDQFLLDARAYIKSQFGDLYLPKVPKKFKAKSKGAQEAHEAIRPTSAQRTPEKMKEYLDVRQFRLYDLIWRRAIASQMADAALDQTGVDIITVQDGQEYVFRARGNVIVFNGFLKVYSNSIKENQLPVLAKGDIVNLKKLESNQHFTQPPSRYNDAGLVKVLEEHGIGRPSTYAPIISTIIERGYVMREEKKLKPTDIALLVNDLLVKHFNNIVDYSFTAKMEEDLDDIARGQKKWRPIIKNFYNPFHINLMQKDKELSKKELTEEATNEKCDQCGAEMIIKMGRFGKFMACSGYPDCRNTKQINENREPKEFEIIDEKCDQCGAFMVKKYGRYGEFLGCSAYPDCKNIKNIEKKIGVMCPKCAKGDIVEKRSKRGKTFYACNRYPDCKTAYWSKPIEGESKKGKECPKCSALLVYGPKDIVRCSEKECGYQE